MAYVEPVNRAAVDESGEASQAITECVSDRTHGEADVQVHAHSVNEIVVHRERGRVDLLALKNHRQKRYTSQLNYSNGVENVEIKSGIMHVLILTRA